MRIVVLVGYLGFVALGGAVAQSPCTKITGRVTMDDGRLLSGATITAKNSKTKKIEEASSDNKGEYSLCLSPGKYDFSARAPGFRLQKRRPIWTGMVPDTIVDFVLRFNYP